MRNKKVLWILFVLAVTQVIGWGTIARPRRSLSEL